MPQFIPSRARLHPALGALALPICLLSGWAASPARADMVIHLTNGQTIQLPYKRADVARIEYVGEAATAPAAGIMGPAPMPATPSTAWVVNAQGAIYQRIDGQWQRLPGSAKAIAAGANGAVWVIGHDNVPGGHSLFRWTGGDWERTDGGGVQLAVAPDGEPWVIDAQGRILRRSANRWQVMPGAAKDIGIGADGSVWVVGLDPAQGGFGIHRWTGNQWAKIDGGAVRLAVGPDGQPWVITASGQVVRRSSGRWQTLPGQATDIGVGSDGSAWMLGQAAAGGNHGIHQWNGSQWVRVDGSAVGIAVK